MANVSKQRIIEYIHTQHQASVKELADRLDISRQLVHKQLKVLQAEGRIRKIGQAPKVLYILNTATVVDSQTIKLAPSVEDVINERYLYITVDGRVEYGVKGFVE